MHANYLLISLVVVAIAGCEQSRVFSDEEKIKAMAAEWPPYRAPTMSDETLPARMRFPFDGTRRGERPQLDTPIRVIKPYRQWTITETAIDSLGRLGAAGVPRLVTTLDDPDPRNRLQAARVLARIGPAASEAVPALIAAMRDNDFQVRRAAIRALGQIGPPAAAAIDDLIAIIEQDERGLEASPPQIPDGRSPRGGQP